MRITQSQLRKLIREVLLSEISDEALGEPPSERYKNLRSPSTGVSTLPPVPAGSSLSPSIWDEVIDFFLPGTPVADGYEIINTFSDIIDRRLQYNKQNNLPPETKTQEEIEFRERLNKSTPFFGYPSSFEFLDVIENVKSGKDVRPETFESLKQQKTGETREPKYKSDEKLNARPDRREEVKRMWLDIDEPDGDTKGYWVKSAFKPASTTEPNAVYYMPSEMPTLTTQQFDSVYQAIMKTRRPDGTFPGGNSEDVFFNLDLARLTDSSVISDTKARGLAKYDLGNFKFGAGEDGGRKYISVYDEWDLFPPALTDTGINIQQFGKIPLIYYRIYRS